MVFRIFFSLLFLDFWDTAGQEKFQSMHPSYYHQAHACILVFDATRKNTYKSLSNWYTEMRNYRPSIPCICAVNKIDGKNLIVNQSSVHLTKSEKKSRFFLDFFWIFLDFLCSKNGKKNPKKNQDFFGFFPIFTR